MSKGWAKGSTAQWRKIRAWVLLDNRVHNEGRCTLHIPGVCTGQATQVHHTRGKAYGDDPKYLMAVCQACNNAIGDPTKNNPQPKPQSNW